MTRNILIDLDSPDPTLAINGFLSAMNEARRLGFMPKTEHILAEHLFRADARVIYYSSACGIVSLVESGDRTDDDFDTDLEIIEMIGRRRKRNRLAKASHREMVAGDIELTHPTSTGEGDGR